MKCVEQGGMLKRAIMGMCIGAAAAYGYHVALPCTCALCYTKNAPPELLGAGALAGLFVVLCSRWE